jgi:hypothetical protein
VRRCSRVRFACAALAENADLRVCRNAGGLAWFDGFFDKARNQIGYWRGDHVLDLNGRVILVQHGARVERVSMPLQQRPPSPPRIRHPSNQPPLHTAVTGLTVKNEWARANFENGVSARIRAFIDGPHENLRN